MPACTQRIGFPSYTEALIYTSIPDAQKLAETRAVYNSVRSLWRIWNVHTGTNCTHTHNFCVGVVATKSNLPLGWIKEFWLWFWQSHFVSLELWQWWRALFGLPSDGFCLCFTRTLFLQTPRWLGSVLMTERLYQESVAFKDTQMDVSESGGSVPNIAAYCCYYHQYQ